MVVTLDKYKQTRNISLSLPFGEVIALSRKNQGMSLERLGESIGYSQSIVSRMETGGLEIEPDSVASMARALNDPKILDRYCFDCPVSAAKRKMQPKPAA